MDTLSKSTKQLPDNLEDLSKFVLIGREKLNAVRAEIRAIEKVQLAAEVHEQKLNEAQEIAEAVLDAEAKLGELTAKMEKAVNQHSANRNGAKSKGEQLAEIGLNKDAISRFETLASHPEQVEQAKADARANGRIVTRQDVLNRIAPPKTQQQSMKEFKQQAREEHAEFKEARKEDVVSLEDIKKDKENEEIISLDIEITVNKALSAVLFIQTLKVEELEMMVRNLTAIGKTTLMNRAREATRTLAYLQRKIGGE